MATINIRDLARVADFLDEINDPRRTEYGNIRHKLADIIVIAFTAALCGYEDYEEMEEFGRLKQDFFKTFLELPNGVPDESVFRRVAQCLNPYQLKEGFEGMENGEIRDLPEDRQGEAERGHGRKERREIRTATGLYWLENRRAWQDARTIVPYRRFRTFRTVKGKETVQTDQAPSG